MGDAARHGGSVSCPYEVPRCCHLQGAPFVIEVQGLSKRYPSGEGVRGLTFTVGAGELFVFLGPNGAGKSSTVKMLTGLLTPDAGWARVAGYDVVRQRLALKSEIGYMAEQPFLYEKLTGREFLRFVADVYRVRRYVRDRRILDLLETFELSDAADSLIETYSQGMRQKIALASVLIHEPRVLFLDEPTNGLDPRSARLVKDILRHICGRGATVFLTTHVLEIAEQMCDRVGILHEGELIALGSLDELRRSQGLPGASLETIFLRLTGAAEPTFHDLYAGVRG
jgi:ABC-2 type transport system ATP-binding protein